MALKTFQNLNQGGSGNQLSTQDSNQLPGVVKPNPFVIVQNSDEQGVDKKGGEDKKETVVFTYPKSKIFVGGLDFRLS